MNTDYRTILRELAPCGLDCSRCFGYADGEIRKLAEALSDKLDNFAPVAERLSQVVPAFKDYHAFQALLTVMSGASCPECRGRALSTLCGQDLFPRKRGGLLFP